MDQSVGKVFLIGGGPGDPGLITLRGCECLERADVVVYDYLVNPQILEHARPGARLECLGRHGRERIMPADEVNARLVRLAREGHVVARLKGGDPAVFAHAADEITTLEAAGIPYEIVPGITAALAAGSYAGIPLTHGLAASAVALVTGQERDGKQTANLDYRALAAFPGTLVFYMGITTARHWTAELLAGGKSPATPAAIVRRCSWSDQEVITTTLGEVAQVVEARRLRPPALVIVGEVASLAPARTWFVDRPLFGTRVLVTRAAHQAQDQVKHLNEFGADVLLQPAIEIGAPADWQPVDDAIEHLDRFDWLVFSSTNGVSAFLNRLLLKRDAAALAKVRLAAIGPGSAEELAGYHLRADVVPEQYRAEALAAALVDEAAMGKRFLLVRASRGREVLAETLAAAGGQVQQVVAYTSRDVTIPDPHIAEQLQAGNIDWVMVSSSAIARSLSAMFGPALGQSKLVSISPITTATLRELGHQVALEAAEYTLAGMVEAIIAAHRRPPSR